MSEPDFLDLAEAALGSTIFEGSLDPVGSDVVQEAPAGDTLTIDALGNAHGADGKFVSQPAPEEQAEASEEPADELQTAAEEAGSAEEAESIKEAASQDEDTVLEIDDPELLELIENKYGGDLLKALHGLKESQSLIGRQGQELGELRDLREQLEQYQQDMQEELARQRMVASYDWDELISEDPGQAAQMAVEIRDPALLQKAVEAWGEENPFQAMMFMNQLANAAAQEAANQQAPAPQDLSTAVGSLTERYPDLRETLPAIQELAAQRPVLAQALEVGDPTSRAQALEDLYLLAKSQSSASDTSKATQRILLKAKAEADAAKADAAVVAATNTSVTSSAPEKPNSLLEETLQSVFGDDSFVIPD